MFNNIFFLQKLVAVYNMMWKIMPELDRPQRTI